MTDGGVRLDTVVIPAKAGILFKLLWCLWEVTACAGTTMFSCLTFFPANGFTGDFGGASFIASAHFALF